MTRAYTTKSNRIELRKLANWHRGTSKRGFRTLIGRWYGLEVKGMDVIYVYKIYGSWMEYYHRHKAEIWATLFPEETNGGGTSLVR